MTIIRLEGDDLEGFRDAIAKGAFGMTRAEAAEQGICISCKKPYIPMTPSEIDEYKRSCLCFICLQEIAG